MLDNKQLLKEIKALLIKQNGDDIADIILFGSQARENSGVYSDFDLLIIVKSDYDWEYRQMIINLLYEINLKYDIILDIHLLSHNELKNSLRGIQPIYQNAIEQGIHA